jgi:hypothetical protein
MQQKPQKLRLWRVPSVNLYRACPPVLAQHFKTSANDSTYPSDIVSLRKTDTSTTPNIVPIGHR